MLSCHLTMYVPGEFEANDETLAWSVVEQNPFGLLLDPSSGAFSHVPFLVNREQRLPAKLRAHVSARNPLARQLEGASVSVVFTGPNTYVSPLWYEHPDRQVPTWNYVAAEVQGRVSLLEPEPARVFLDELCARFEGPSGYRPSRLAPALLEAMLREIVAFEIAVERIVGKFKLSQNRSPKDRKRVMNGLAARASSDDSKVLEWMRRTLG